MSDRAMHRFVVLAVLFLPLAPPAAARDVGWQVGEQIGWDMEAALDDWTSAPDLPPPDDATWLDRLDGGLASAIARMDAVSDAAGNDRGVAFTREVLLVKAQIRYIAFAERWSCSASLAADACDALEERRSRAITKQRTLAQRALRRLWRRVYSGITAAERHVPELAYYDAVLAAPRVAEALERRRHPYER